jgi:X-X-X-Leu-X-X-Gly heptad repeat protein
MVQLNNKMVQLNNKLMQLNNKMVKLNNKLVHWTVNGIYKEGRTQSVNLYI